MKKLALTVVGALLLAGCAGEAGPGSTPQSVESASGGGASSAAAPSAAGGGGSVSRDVAVSSAPAAPSRPAPEPEESLVFTLYEGTADEKQFLVTFNFPDGLYYQGSNLYRTEADVVPEAIFSDPVDESDPMFSLKVGGLYRAVLEESQFVDEYTIELPEMGVLTAYHRAEDESLPARSFYRLGDRIAFTSEGAEDSMGVVFKSTYYYIPLEGDEYVVLWFFHNVDSVGAKAFFEEALAGVTVVEAT